MPIVTVRELTDRLGSPAWAPEVRRDADRLIATLTGTLAARLGTFIEPGPERSERAPVSETGMIVTDYPVHTVHRVDGVDAVHVGDTVDAPPGWVQRGATVLRAGLTSGPGATFPSPAAYASPIVDTAGLAGMLGGAVARAAHPDGPPTVMIDYLPGWGRHEALRGAIIAKAAALMVNHHDDTITARALEGQTPPSMTEDWTDAEIAALSAFRNRPGPTWTRW